MIYKVSVRIAYASSTHRPHPYGPNRSKSKAEKQGGARFLWRQFVFTTVSKGRLNERMTIL